MRISDWSSDVCSSDLRPYRSNGMPAFAGMTIIELPPAQLQAALHDGAAGLERRSPGGGTTLHRHGSDPAVAQGEGCIAVTVIMEGGGSAVGRRSEEHTSAIQTLTRIPYAALCLKKKNITH